MICREKEGIYDRRVILSEEDIDCDCLRTEMRKWGQREMREKDLGIGERDFDK